jgi:hypothetical protein
MILSRLFDSTNWTGRSGTLNEKSEDSDMTKSISNLPQRSVARMAGIFYLSYTFMFAFSSFVQHQLIVWGDAATTATNIVASERLFRLGFMSDVIATLLFLLTAWALYVLLNSVNTNLALLFLLLNLAGAAVECASTMIHFAAVPILTGGDYLKVFRPDQIQALSLFFLSSRYSSSWEAAQCGYLCGIS